MLSKSHDYIQTLYWKSSIQGLIEVLLLIIHELGVLTVSSWTQGTKLQLAFFFGCQ